MRLNPFHAARVMNEPIHRNSPIPETTESGDDVAFMIGFLSVFAAISAVFFAVRYFYLAQVDNWIGVALIVFAAILVLNTLLYSRLGSLELMRWGFVTVITALLSFVVFNGLEQGAGILWLYVFPPMVFYVTSLRIGLLLCVMAYAVVIIALTPLGPIWTGIHEYSPTFSMVFVFTLGFVMLFSYVLDRSRRRYTERLRYMAEIFEYAAKHDSLTGLYNRREASQRLADEYARFQRHGTSFSVALVDIDNFKRINDTLGHDTGDDVIRNIAERLHAGCRQIDMVARWGGEEFLLMLPESNLEQAVTSVQRIRESISGSPVQAGGRPMEVTCSFGVAEVREGEAIQELLQRVDERLYDAKTRGRNRVVSKGITER